MNTPANAESINALTRVKRRLAHLEHVLPTQAPLRSFVHHNTLHAFPRQPFAEAFSAASRLTGANTWLDEDRCCHLYRQGRVTATLRHAPRGLSALRIRWHDEGNAAFARWQNDLQPSPARQGGGCHSMTQTLACIQAGTGPENR